MTGLRRAGAAVVVALAIGCHDGSSPSGATAPAGVGPTNDFGAYGRNPPPPDAPKAAWPEQAARPGSAGCSTKRAPGAVTKTIDVPGGKRTFTLVVPTGEAPEAPLPLVIAFHGHGGNAETARRDFAALEKAAGGRAVFAFPAGPGGWDLDEPAGTNADVAFFDALLFSVANESCVDLQKVYLTGFSNGAYMANQLACRRSSRVRAVATHGGGGPYEAAGRYDAQGNLLCEGRSVAAMVVHGQADRAVLPSEGDKSVAHHRAANRCGSGTHQGPLPSCRAFDACTQPVVSCVVPGLGHAVSPEAARASWSFFEALR